MNKRDQLTAIRERQMRLTDESSGILDLMETEKRDLKPEERGQYDKLTAEILSLEAKASGLARAMERELAARLPDEAPPLPQFPGEMDRGTAEATGPIFKTPDGREVRAFQHTDRLSAGEELSIGAMIRGYATGNWTGADAERRAMGNVTGAAGGFLAPTGVSKGLIDLARNKAACFNAGALTLPMDSGEMHLVRWTGDPTAYWRAENASLTASDPTIERLTLNAKTMGVLVQISVELAEDASNASQVIENALAASLAIELDRVGAVGAGVTEPRGLFYTDGIGEVSMGANGAAPTDYDEFSEAVEACWTANEKPTACLYAPRTAGTLDRLKEATTNAPLPAPASFQSLDKFVTTQIPITQTQGSSSAASCALIGDFRQLAFGMRTQLTIEATRTGNSDAFSKMQIAIRAYLRADVGVLRPGAFCVIKGITV